MSRVTTALVDDASPRRAIEDRSPAERSTDRTLLRRFLSCGGLPPGRGRPRRRPAERLAGRSGCGSARQRPVRRLAA